MKEEFLLSSLISDVIIKHTRHVLANLKCPLVQTCAVGNICFEVNPSKRACYWLFSADTWFIFFNFKYLSMVYLHSFEVGDSVYFQHSAFGVSPENVSELPRTTGRKVYEVVTFLSVHTHSKVYFLRGKVRVTRVLAQPVRRFALSFPFFCSPQDYTMELKFSQEERRVLDQHRWSFLLSAAPGARSCNKLVTRTRAMDHKESCPSVSIPSSDEHREKKKRFTVSIDECKHCREMPRLLTLRCAPF